MIDLMLNFLITQVPRYIPGADPLHGVQGSWVPQALSLISTPEDLYVVVNGLVLHYMLPDDQKPLLVSCPCNQPALWTYTVTICAAAPVFQIVLWRLGSFYTMRQDTAYKSLRFSQIITGSFALSLCR